MQNKLLSAGDCIQWAGAKNSAGYGAVYVGDNRTALVHRRAYEVIVGPIADDMTIDHLCSNKLCVNTDHMEVVTRVENVKRRFSNLSNCPRGHEFSDENTYTHPNGKRECKTCRHERWLKKRTELREGRRKAA
jgi:hypothetical protein